MGNPRLFPRDDRYMRPKHAGNASVALLKLDNLVAVENSERVERLLQL